MLKVMYQGFFVAPHVVGESLKGAIYTARLLEKIGVETKPSSTDKRTDIIQSVVFHNEEAMIKFCEGIQSNYPVNSFVALYLSYMHGYYVKVIMVAVTLI